MLHAINNRKARLSAFRGAGIRVPLEDVVTSTIFGPLEFMAPVDRERAIAGIAEALALPIPAAEGSLSAQFWPRFPLSQEGLRARYSEPDLVITDSAGPLVVVEVKWGAPLSENELAAQWISLAPLARRRAIHLLLVQDPEAYRHDFERDGALIEQIGEGPWRSFLKSWRTMASLPLLTARPGTYEAVRRWADAVGAFLRREDRLALHGWDEIGLRLTKHLGWQFRQPWLSQFHTVEKYEEWWTND
jgi:hypothetical protein